jgi:hypothetical protein
MEIRDRQTLNAVAEVAGLLATAYQRYRRAHRIEIAGEMPPKAVNGELDNRGPESLHGARESMVAIGARLPAEC